MRQKREDKYALYYKEEKEKLLPFSERDYFIAGLFLYWGEGNKADRHTIGVSNTDPNVIKFTINWMTKCFHFPKKIIRIHLHLYSDMDIGREISYWAKELKLDKSHFSKPYIKTSNKDSLDQKGLFGHGTCNVKIHRTEAKERVLMSIKAINDVCGKM